MSLEETLAEIFIDVLRPDDGHGVRQMKYRVTDGWDSLAHMELIAAIEEKFDIAIDSVDVLRINSFESAVKIIGTKYHVPVEA